MAEIPVHPEAVVALRDIERTAGTLFRALGRDAGLRVAATDVQYGAFLQSDTLRLPQWLACFPEARLNRELYYWLIALAANFDAEDAADWGTRNRRAIQRTLTRNPGLQPRFDRLRAAAADMTPSPLELREPPQVAPAAATGPAGTRTAKEAKDGGVDREHRSSKSERIVHSEKLTNPTSITEFIKVQTNEAAKDNKQPDAVKENEGVNPTAMGRDGSTVSSRLRLDIDAPASGHDDILVGPGIPVDEWDYRKHMLLPDHCRVQELIGRHDGGIQLPEHLRKHAARLKQQFSALVPQRHWLKGQPDGSEPDIDACVRLYADHLAARLGGGGAHDMKQDVYLAQQHRERDLSCLVLADLSLSTDAWVTHNQRVIDVIRDTLMLFSEALTATGDKFGLYGFSSQRREQVRFHRIKEFNAPYDPIARGRIAGLKPGFYTRIGAAVRHATKILEKQESAMRVLLVLTDGKPHDIDYYEERYGIEDTRMALMEAKKKRIKPFCVTIDREGSHYLPHLFGVNGYTVLRRPEELSSRLPILYAQLTGQN
ncbi:MAG TPA: VWA domain-containing protein [Rhodocyclaceae bacterium]